MRPDRMVLSAYIDGEVPQRFVPEIEAAIEHDPEVRATYEALRSLRDELQVEVPVDLDESSRRSWEAISSRIGQSRQRDVWHRRVALPLPALAAAATLVLALAGVLVWSLLPSSDVPGEQFARANDVDVTIRVDGSDMEQVLQWLVDKNMLGEINIQLPEQQFRIVGEPVFVKPAGYGGDLQE